MLCNSIDSSCLCRQPCFSFTPLTTTSWKLWKLCFAFAPSRAIRLNIRKTTQKPRECFIGLVPYTYKSTVVDALSTTNWSQNHYLSTIYSPISLRISEALATMEGFANIGIVTCLLALLSLTKSAYATQTNPSKPMVSAFYMFGDSTVDSGNNDGLATVFKTNFPPYGRDLADHKPTGRFSNGKLPTDILCMTRRTT